MAHCFFCGDDTPDPKILEHLRIMHPEAYGEGPQRWPDGGLVIVDATDYSPDDVAEG